MQHHYFCHVLLLRAWRRWGGWIRETEGWWGDRWARTLSRYSTCSVCTESVLQWLFATHFTFFMRSEASRGIIAELMLPANPATQCTMQSTKVTDNVPAITLWPAILSAITLIIVNVNSRSLLMYFLLCDINTLNDWWQRVGMVIDMTHCSRHLISILAHVPCLVNHCLMKVWMALVQVSCLWRTLTKWITLVIGLRSFFGSKSIIYLSCIDASPLARLCFFHISCAERSALTRVLCVNART